MARWFRPVLSLLVFANVTGLASLVVWWVPVPGAIGGLSALAGLWRTASAPALVFALSLVLVLLAARCGRRVPAPISAPPATPPPGGTTGAAAGGHRLAAGAAPTLPAGSLAPGWAVAAHAALAVAAVLAFSGLASGPWMTGHASAGDRRAGSFVILAVNDVYRIEGLDGGKVGGLARLRTIRAELERASPGRVLFLHGGDVLFPSFLSRMFKGQQMIATLNLMDGDATPGRLDERMFVTFGNHEFDQEVDCAPESVLQARVSESDFFWLHSNISLTPCQEGQPRLVGANLLQARIVEIGGLRVGLFGLTIATVIHKADGNAPTSFRFLDALETARALTTDLRRRGADVVIAVTHLNWRDDLRLLAELRGQGLDLVAGGHDHAAMSLPRGTAEPRIFKADADAVTAWVLTVTRHPDGRVEVAGTLRKLDDGVAPDPLVAGKVAALVRSHDVRFCQEAAARGDWLGPRPDSATCLDERLAVTETALDASEEKIRTRETSLGDWVTDQMAAAFAACGVDGAFVNAGALRLNHDLPANSEITRRHLEELMQFPSPLQIYRLTHQALRQALANAVSVPDAGRWLQVSDQIAFTYQPVDEDHHTPARILKVAVRPPGQAPIAVTDSSAGTVRIVANEYLQKGSMDGFDRILPPPEEAACPAAGRDLKEILYQALRSQARIRPGVQGRICTEAESRRRPCRADQWVP